MTLGFLLIQGLNALALGGLLFLLASGFSLIFGLMRIANLSHGAYFMLGAYVGLTVLRAGWATIALLGGVVERAILSRLAERPLAQVLVTLGLAFIIADLCLMLWTGDPMPLPPPPWLRGPLRLFGFAFPAYRVFVVAVALVSALALWLLLERTRLGAMVRAGVDDMQMARGLGIP